MFPIVDDQQKALQTIILMILFQKLSFQYFALTQKPRSLILLCFQLMTPTFKSEKS